MSEFERLCQIMDELRAKCPWDQKQTLESLSHLTIEEVYELYDAIREGNTKNIKEEIADIMLHLVFYAKILNEQEGVTIEELLELGNEKLIQRHPHIYGNAIAETVEDVKKNWEINKLKEGRKSIFSGVPLSLPSVIKAYRIQDKAAQRGFDWPNYEQVRAKLNEEIIEFDEAIQGGNPESIMDEMGDLMFTMVNLARFLRVDPEMALQKCNAKFISRFQYIEDHATKPLEDMSLDEMEILWQKAKAKKSAQ